MSIFDFIKTKKIITAIFIKRKKLPFGIAGIALFPFVFYNKQYYCDSLYRHEMIHIHQQIEMLILPFYVWYLIEWCIRRMKSKSWSEAYRNISFEREAYRNDFKEDCLKIRKHYAWLKYL